MLHGRRRHLHMTSLKLRCDPSKLHLHWIPVTDNTEKPPQLKLQWTPQWSDCEFVKSSETFWVIFLRYSSEKSSALYKIGQIGLRSEKVNEFVNFCEFTCALKTRVFRLKSGFLKGNRGRSCFETVLSKGLINWVCFSNIFEANSIISVGNWVFYWNDSDVLWTTPMSLNPR